MQDTSYETIILKKYIVNNVETTPLVVPDRALKAFRGRVFNPKGLYY